MPVIRLKRNVPGDAVGCQALWTAVVARALLDLTSPQELERIAADRWFRRGADLHRICSLAGLDGSAVREAYLAGRFNAAALVGRDADGQRRTRHRVREAV